MKTVLIIGLGEFGSNIAKRMVDFKCEVMAVDINEERVDEILPFVTNARIGDSTNAEFLRSLGVSNYDVCIVALGGLFQSSLETTSLLKEFGAPFVVSRATNDVQMKFLKMSRRGGLSRKADGNTSGYEVRLRQHSGFYPA